MKLKSLTIYVCASLVAFLIGTTIAVGWSSFHQSKLKAWPTEPPVAFQPSKENRDQPCKIGMYVWSAEIKLSDGELYDPFCRRIQIELTNAAGEGNVDKVKKLLREGANPNAGVYEHLSPIYAAVENHRIEVVRLLLDNGVSANSYEELLWWPLPSAVYHHDTEMVNLLLSRGADFTKEYPLDGRDRTPLNFAEDKGYDDIVELLDEAGASTWQHRTNRRIAKLTGNRYHRIFQE